MGGGRERCGWSFSANQTVQLALVGCTSFWPLLSCLVIREQSLQLRNCLLGVGKSKVFCKEFGPNQRLRSSLSRLQAMPNQVENGTSAGEFEIS